MPLIPLDIARAVVQLETLLQEISGELAGEACAHCVQCCCHTDLCEEAVRSPFLKAIRAVSPTPSEPFCDRYGWLSPTGCRLRAGRPAACYHYWCEALRAQVMEHDHADLLSVAAGSLVYFHQQPHGLLLSDLSEEALAGVDWEIVRQRIAELRSLLAGSHPAPAELRARLSRLADEPV